MLPFIHPLSHKFICYYSTEEIVSIVAINNVVCTVHYDLLSATTTAAIVVLVTGFLPSFASSLQLRFEEGYDSGEGLLLGLAALLDDDDVDC
jgi:hypothetical protein